MSARAASREASIVAPSFGCFSRNASATASHRVSASALLSWAKIVFGIAATAARLLAGTWASAFLTG